LHYPEILEQYNNDELNQFKLKNGQIKTKGGLSDLWNSVESWFENAADDVSNWWKTRGSDIVEADFEGAGVGAYLGFRLGWHSGQLIWTMGVGTVGLGLLSSSTEAGWF
jgi:hypothetical protein